ncbi:SusC/RagA family TonB-linked outer membrane protein [Gaetbulibacter sp. M240]|uniref:SusC/RagA family TonB-linked outer membrane protein n=1 Tax=Gaetbulibacter sp. M240 TaxID=3126511 RepID=UPI00374E3C8F
MRMIIFLLCTTVFSLTPETTFSQEKVIINQDQTVSANEVFNIIQQQTNYHFIFPKRLFANAPAVLLEKGEISAINLLKKALQNSNLEFTIDDNNTILIKKVKPEQTRRQQKVNISGTITDEEGMPLAGVTILEKGTTNGVVTDFNGAYTITVRDDAILEYSYIGFVSATLNVGDLTYYTNVNIQLKEDVNDLAEVVVTGYQILSKERATGSFETVKESQLQQRPAATFLERIVGQVPGVNVSPATGKIEIRGRSTLLNGGDDVLIVVDGFPLTRQEDYNTINPEDIETLTVLKDAAAASVWGARASNGVIVITTKTGDKNKKLSVDYSSFVEFENKVNLDDLNFLDVNGEIDADLEFIEKNWIDPALLGSGIGSINDLHLAYVYRNGNAPDGTLWSQNTFDNYINNLRSREDVTKQLEKYLFRNAFRQTHNLTLSGGGERNTYFASISYTDYQAATIGDEDDRLTFNLRNTFDFSDKIKFTAGITTVLRTQKANGVDTGRLRELQAYDEIVDENGQYVQKYASYNPWLSQEREAIVGSPHTFNILEEQRNLDNSSQFLDLRADFKMDVELFDGFVVTPSFRYERGAGIADNYRNMSLPSHRNLINSFYKDGTYQIPVGSDYEREQEYYKGWTMRNTFNYDKTFGKHDITLFGGVEYNRRYRESDVNRAFGYNRQATLYVVYDEFDLFRRQITDFNNFSIDANIYRANNFQRVSNSDNRFVAYFANLGYTFNNKYLLNASYRVDQANIFGSDPDFRYKPLWSVGAGWKLSKESFMNNVDWVDNLTLRATYGLNGNTLVNASPYATASSRTNTYRNSYFFSRLFRPANPGLKWEETATQNYALDFGLFNNRLSGSIEYYKRISTDVYGSTSLDPTVGFTSALVNYASIENTGWEFQLSANIVDNQDFGWTIRGNFNSNDNVITDIESPFDTAQRLAQGLERAIGDPVNNFYSYNFAGLDANGEATFFDRNGVATHWADARNNFTKEDVVFSGNKTPQVYGGFSTTVRYKGFDLTANLNFAADFAYRYDTNRLNTGAGSYNADFYGLEFSNIRLDKTWGNRWRNPGDENITNVPRMFYEGLNPRTGENERSFFQARQDLMWSYSTVNTHKGDYIRVQDIILGYTFSEKLLNTTFLNNLRLTMQVTNPFLWVSNDLGIDPTISTSQAAYSNLTRFTFGLRANF